MVCYIHEQKSANGACVHCGKLICDECITQIKGKNYCKSCVIEIFEEHERKLEKLENRNVSNQPTVFINTVNADVRFVCTKSKIAAGLLALLFGSFGVHKFYLGNVGIGFLYLFFCWTGISSIIALIDGILLLCMTDNAFCAKYGVEVPY